MSGFRLLYEHERASWRGEAQERRARLVFAPAGHDGDEALPEAVADLDRSESEVGMPWVVVADDAVSGWMWLQHDAVDRTLRVLDTTVGPHLVNAAVHWLRAHAAALDCAAVAVTSWPGDRATGEVARALGGDLFATRMTLRFEGRPPGVPARVRLLPMTSPQYDAYVARATVEYRQHRIAAGETPERATVAAHESFSQLWPEGVASPGQWIWTAYDDEVPVGILWIGDHGPQGWVYEVEVAADVRRRGYGAEIMTAGARWCFETGRTGLGLNVFGPNVGARALYERLGYAVVEQGYRAGV